MTPKPACKVWDELVNKKWHTEFTKNCGDDNVIQFNGFYGNYEVEVTVRGKTVKKELALMKDTTGYHHHINVDYGLRTKTIVID